MTGLPGPERPPARPRNDAVDLVEFPSKDLARLGAAFWVLQAYLFLVLSNLAEHFQGFGRLRPLWVLGCLVVVSAVVQYVQRPPATARSASTRHSPSAWLAAFAAAVAASWAFAFDSNASGKAFEQYVTTLLVHAFVVLLVRDRRGVQVTAVTIAAGVGVFLAMSVREWFAGRHEYRMGVVRMIGIGGSQAGPNDFAATLTSTAPIVIWIGTRARSRWLRGGAALYGLVMSYAVLMASSRSGAVAWLLCAGFAVFSLPSRRARLVAVGVAVALAAAGVGLLTDSQIERLASVVEPETYETESSTVGRVTGYKVAWRVFTDRPLLGVGPGGFVPYRRTHVDGVPLQTHNLGGQVIAEFGAVGTIAFVGYLWACVAFALAVVRRLRGNADPWGRAVAALGHVTLFTLFVMFVAGLAGHNLLRVHWYLLPALLVVADATARNASGAPRTQVPGGPTPGNSGAPMPRAGTIWPPR